MNTIGLSNENECVEDFFHLTKYLQNRLNQYRTRNVDGKNGKNRKNKQIQTNVLSDDFLQLIDDGKQNSLEASARDRMDWISHLWALRSAWQGEINFIFIEQTWIWNKAIEAVFFQFQRQFASFIFSTHPYLSIDCTEKYEYGCIVNGMYQL